MSATAPPDQVQSLVELLALRAIAPDTYAGSSAGEGLLYGGGSRRFGGELLAQALRAAEATIEGRPVHSLHGYFVRPARRDADVVYRVQRVRDGRSFAVRSVEGWQDSAVAFILEASFQTKESGFEHAAAMPRVAGPAELPSEQERFEQARAREPERFRDWGAHWFFERGPFETRIVEDLWQTPTSAPTMHWWVRLRRPLAAAHLMPAITAYFSDDPIMDNALLPHIGRFGYERLTTASLDHAIWYHVPIDLSHWHLFAQDSPVATGARGLTRGQLFDAQGVLVASVAQEVLMRPRG